jgi:hypothetical protein
MFKLLIASVVVFDLILMPTAVADDVKIFWVEPGQNIDVYWSIDLSGSVFVVADHEGQAACLDYWWIAWPFTQIVQLGRHCGRATFKLPGFGNYAIGGKLRAGAADIRTRIQGTSNEVVAHGLPGLAF